MLALARKLPRDRFQPEFVLLTERGIHAGIAEAEGIPLHLLGVRRPGVNPIRFVLSLIRAGVRYVRLSRRGRIDIVDAWLYHGYALASLTRPLTRVPVLLAGRRSLADFKETFGLVDRIVDAISKRVPDLIIANSFLVRDDAVSREHVPASKLLVIRNGVEIPGPVTEADRAAVRAAWGVGAGDLVIGCVSNYKSGKGLEMLVEAFAGLPAGPTATRLVLIGEGPLRRSLVAIADRFGVADRTVFHGLAPDVRSLLPAIDVFVHPSETEGLPNAVLEAAAAGLPIVGTDAGATREIVVDDRTGLLVPIRDRPALERALGRLLADSRLREALGGAARQHVAESFGMDRFVTETAELYERLAAERRIGGA
jgi:glycosyltransferase involved in cell wall biosynthesis